MTSENFSQWELEIEPPKAASAVAREERTLTRKTSEELPDVPETKTMNAISYKPYSVLRALAPKRLNRPEKNGFASKYCARRDDV